MQAQTPRLVFLFVLAIYLMTAAGHLDTIDADASVETAYSIWERQSLATAPLKAEPMVFRETAHGQISKMGWALPLLYVPFVGLSKALSLITSIPDRVLMEFFVSFVNAFISLGILVGLYLHMRWNRRNRKSAVFLCVAMGLGTLLFPYAKTAHREPLQALLLLMVAVLSLNHRRFSDQVRLSWAIGLTTGLGLLAKLALVVPMAPFLAYRFAQRQSGTSRLALLVPIMGALLFYAGVSFIYLGTKYATGYSPEVVNLESSVWSTPFLSGVHAQWFHPDTGLLIHCPLLLVLLALFFRRWRTRQVAGSEWLVLAAIALQTALYAKWFSPTGGAALGPRYLVVIIPLFGLLLGRIKLPLPPKTRLQFLGLFILSWSFLQQTVNASVKAQQYWSMRAIARSSLPMPHWMANLELFFHKSEGRAEVYGAETFGGSDDEALDLRGFETLQGLNYWWLHATRFWLDEQPLEKPAPESVSISKMDKTNQRNDPHSPPL